jgi:hypothetical protein
LDTAIKTVIIPMSPNSPGERIRASIIPTKKEIPELAKVSIALQLTPCIAFFFKLFIKLLDF